LPHHAVHAPGHSRRVADGAALFFLWSQAPGDGPVQPAAETRVHLDHRVRRAVAAHRDRLVQTRAVFVAGVSIRRVSSRAGVAFRRDVRLRRVYSRAPDHGPAARLVEFLLHAFGMETRAGISGIGKAAIRFALMIDSDGLATPQARSSSQPKAIPFEM